MPSFNEYAALAGSAGSSLGQIGQMLIGAAGGDPSVLNPAIQANQGTQQAAIQAEEEKRREEERKEGMWKSLASSIGEYLLGPIGAAAGTSLAGGSGEEALYAAGSSLLGRAQSMIPVPTHSQQLNPPSVQPGGPRQAQQQATAPPASAQSYNLNDQIELTDPYTGRPRQFVKTKKGWDEIYSA